MDAKNLKFFCQDHFPRFSKRVNLGHFDFASETIDVLPKVMLLSTKKDTPVIWRALSGLYHKSFVFYDAEVATAMLYFTSYCCLFLYLVNKTVHFLLYIENM